MGNKCSKKIDKHKYKNNTIHINAFLDILKYYKIEQRNKFFLEINNILLKKKILEYNYKLYDEESLITSINKVVEYSVKTNKLTIKDITKQTILNEIKISNYYYCYELIHIFKLNNIIILLQYRSYNNNIVYYLYDIVNFKYRKVDNLYSLDNYVKNKNPYESHITFLDVQRISDKILCCDSNSIFESITSNFCFFIGAIYRYNIVLFKFIEHKNINDNKLNTLDIVILKCEKMITCYLEYNFDTNYTIKLNYSDKSNLNISCYNKNEIKTQIVVKPLLSRELNMIIFTDELALSIFNIHINNVKDINNNIQSYLDNTSSNKCLDINITHLRYGNVDYIIHNKKIKLCANFHNYVKEVKEVNENSELEIFIDTFNIYNTYFKYVQINYSIYFYNIYYYANIKKLVHDNIINSDNKLSSVFKSLYKCCILDIEADAYTNIVFILINTESNVTHEKSLYLLVSKTNNNKNKLKNNNFNILKCILLNNNYIYNYGLLLNITLINSFNYLIVNQYYEKLKLVTFINKKLFSCINMFYKIGDFNKINKKVFNMFDNSYIKISEALELCKTIKQDDDNYLLEVYQIEFNNDVLFSLV